MSASVGERDMKVAIYAHWVTNPKVELEQAVLFCLKAFPNTKLSLNMVKQWLVEFRCGKPDFGSAKKTPSIAGDSKRKMVTSDSDRVMKKYRTSLPQEGILDNDAAQVTFNDDFCERVRKYVESDPRIKYRHVARKFNILKEQVNVLL